MLKPQVVAIFIELLVFYLACHVAEWLCTSHTEAIKARGSSNSAFSASPDKPYSSLHQKFILIIQNREYYPE